MPFWRARKESLNEDSGNYSASTIELSCNNSFDRKKNKPPPPSYPPPNRSAEPGYFDGVHAHHQSRDDDETSEDTERSRRRRSTYNSVYDSRRSSTLGASVMDTSTLLMSRAIVSGLAIGMLWLSSLSMITSLLRATNALPIPPVQLVVHESVSLFNETARLRETYIDCVQENLMVCNATLTRRQAREADRSEAARRSNVQTRDNARTTQAACATAHARAMASVSAWQQQQGAGGDGSAQYTTACTANERTQLTEMTGDTTAQRSAAFQLSRGYSTSSQSTVGTLAQQVAARAAYDREYLWNRTLRDVSLEHQLGNLSLDYSLSINARFAGLNLTEVLACSTLTGGAPCPDGAGARAMVDAAQRNLAEQYTQAQTTYDATATATANYVSNAATQLTNLGNTLSSIRNSINVQYPEIGFDNMFPGLSIPPVCPFIGRACNSGENAPCGDYTCQITGPIYQPALPTLDIPASDTVDAIAAATAAATDRLQQQLGDAVDNANLDASGLRNTIPAIDAGFPPPDYQPPRIITGCTAANANDPFEGDQACATETQQQHAQESEEFEQDSAVSLDAIDQANSNRTDRGFAPIFSSNISASRLIGAASDTSWFNYRNIESAGFQFEWLLGPIEVISILLQNLDAVWRIFQTLRILRRFWGRSALAVPPVDVTTDFEAKSRAAKVFNPIQAMAVMATSPLVLLCIYISFAFLILGVAFTFYQPIFAAYQTSCTARDANGRPSGDGTVLTANAYALAFNYASHEGNRLRLEGIDAYELERADYCARYGERSANDEQRVATDMDAISASHGRMQADMALMNRCYNRAYLDNAFTTTPVVDENGNAYPLLSTTLDEAACAVALNGSSTLDNGIYDCTELPDCVVTCDDLSDEHGNDQSELFEYSRTAMCTLQYWFHSTILRFVFTVTIYLFANLFRFVFLNGVIRLFWNFFNTGMYTYIATCDIDGVHTYKEEDLSDKVRAMLFRMRLVGVGYVIIAITSQVPWIVAVYYFMSGIVHDTLT